MAVSPHLVPFASILRRLRPEFDTSHQRKVLMAALHEEFSERDLSVVLQDLFEEDGLALLGEAIDAYARLHGSPDVLGMRVFLAEHGWVFEDEDGPRRQGED